jgi:predicted aldo/keto reductase-like oxidoreductase
MSNMQHVQENVASAKTSGISSMTMDELKLISQIRDQYNELAPIPCTKCEYCLPCPNGVNIPRNFEIYNEGAMFTIESAQGAYNNWFAAEENASNCLDCKDCEELCPQQIPISEWMPKIHEALALAG